MRNLRVALMLTAILGTAAPVFAQGQGDYGTGLRNAQRFGAQRVIQFQRQWAQDYARHTQQVQRGYLRLRNSGKSQAANRFWRQGNRNLQQFQRTYKRGVSRLNTNRNLQHSRRTDQRSRHLNTNRNRNPLRYGNRNRDTRNHR
jgi:hypothetical protein